MKKTTRQYIVPAYKVIELGEDILQMNTTSITDEDAIFQKPEPEDPNPQPDSEGNLGGQW